MAEIFLSYRRDDSTSAPGRARRRARGALRRRPRLSRPRDRRRRELRRGDPALGRVGDRAAGDRRAAAGSARAIAAGRRRLDDPADFVRVEIELALAARRRRRAGARRGRDHAAAADLPASLAAFSRCQAVELSDTRWRYDVDRLIEMLHARFAIDRIARPRATGRRLRASRAGAST
jgi:hypothetical protein